MKIILFFLISLSFVYGENKDNFFIDGEIKGNYSGQVYLMYQRTDGSSVNLETAVINKKFHFSGYLEEPVQGSLKVGFNSLKGDIYLDSSHIYIVVEMDSIPYNGKLLSETRLVSINGSFSENFKRDYLRFGQIVNSLNYEDSVKADIVYEYLLSFVKKNPDHNLSSLFLGDYEKFTYKQAKIIYDHLSLRQQQLSIRNGVKKNLERLRKTDIGSEYHFISLPDTTDKLISGKELEFKYMLIEFWSSSCRPCRLENPNLVSSYKKFNKKGFEILSISLDEDRNSWIKAIKKDGLIWTQISDLAGRNNKVAQYYSINYVPFNLLINRKGIIIKKNLDHTDLDKTLSKLLME